MSAIKSPRTLRILQAGAILAAVGTGYAVRDIKTVDAQGAVTAPPVQKQPVVQTPATRDAATTQNAFVDVANAVQPAVVTIETIGARAATPPPTNRRGAPSPFGQGAPGGGGTEEQFREFFKQFGNQFGFDEQNFQENSWHGRVMREKALVAWQEIQNRGGRGGGLGSGMIYRADGLILTNAHVVQDAKTVTVTLSDGQKFKDAKVLGRDVRTDIAVVKIDAKNGTSFPTVQLGDSDEVKVGNWAIAVGNPFGLDHTLTVGVISAKSREIDLAKNGDSRTDYLQTDASINPGNSGGPLLDIYGRVIGINNAIYSESGGNQGIGFAIPVNIARNVADQLAKTGKVSRGYLGVSIKNAEDVSAAFGLDPNLKGVLVESITDPNTPGAKAGLQPGDVITKFNGQNVTKSTELQRAVGNSPVGSAVTITVIRDGNPIQLKATLEELPDTPAAQRPDVAPDAGKGGQTRGGIAVPIPGVKARDLSAAVANALKIKTTKGVVISEVGEDSPATESDLRVGDVITKVGQKSVNTVAEMNAEITRILGVQKGAEKQVALRIERNGQSSFLIVVLGAN